MAIAVAATVAIAGAQRSALPAVASYTAAQAARGDAVYRRDCAVCHGPALEGIERVPALAGAAFLQTWQGGSLLRLLERVEGMPPDRPDRLSPRERADVLAFLLRANGVAAGNTPLVLDRAVLQTVRIVARSGTLTLTAADGPAPSAAPESPARAPSSAAPSVPASGPTVGWPTYGGDLASTRYSPLDQITRANFNDLRIAWRLNTNLFGPRPDGLYSATPLVVGRSLYTTAGTRRAVVALDAGTGELRWMHAEDEGHRGQVATRPGAGRGVAYWASPDGADQRILYVTPGYRMLALDARTGAPIATFGKAGVVDLKQDDDQDIDPDNPDIGLNATPLVAGDVIIVGAAHHAGTAPKTTRNVKGFVRGYDVRTGRRLWIFHTVPMPGEPGFETWEDDGARRNGNTGVWSQMSADLDLGLVYVPVEMATGDYYGGKRPGNTLFDESLVALDIRTGKRKWHFQTVHHGVWDYDLSCAPVLFDLVTGGRSIKALAQATKQAFLFVLNRETGEPVWPVNEEPVPQSTVPGRAVQSDAALSNQAGPIRSPGDLGRRSDRLHAGAARPGHGARQAVPDRPDLHAACAQQLARPDRDVAGTLGPRRRQLAGRLVRPGDRPLLRAFAHEPLCVRYDPRGSVGGRRRLRVRYREAGDADGHAA